MPDLTDHVMRIATQPRGPSGYRASCSCGQLDGVERGDRDLAVADHDAHVHELAAAADAAACRPSAAVT